MQSIGEVKVVDRRSQILKLDGPSSVLNPQANADVDISKYERLSLTADQFRFFKEHGWIKIPGLFNKTELDEINTHLDNVLAGVDEIPGCHVKLSSSKEERQSAFARIDMLHRRHPLHEKYLLHPRSLDVVQQLCSPDVLALQTLCFFKEPGHIGQGYHQDSYYIHTLPNTLIGAWVALTPATKENGCLWLSDRSHVEPLYPNPQKNASFENKDLDGVFPVKYASEVDENVNELTEVGKRYVEVAATADPGDAFFFGGNVLHRSHSNLSKDQARRAFTCHYCDARSLVPWNYGETFEGNANSQHILARGDTHLPYAKPQFGMPVKLNKVSFDG